MKRRSFLMLLTTSFVALGLIGGVALADELLGVLTKVDVDAKKLTVMEKGSDKEIIVTVNDDTEYVTKKGSSKIDLEKVSKNLAKVQDAGKKGMPLKIQHEKGVASKIEPAAKKKDAN